MKKELSALSSEAETLAEEENYTDAHKKMEEAIELRESSDSYTHIFVSHAQPRLRRNRAQCSL